MYNKNDIETLINIIEFEKETTDYILEELEKNKEVTIKFKINSYGMYDTIVIKKITENGYDINLEFHDRSWYEKKQEL